MNIRVKLAALFSVLVTCALAAQGCVAAPPESGDEAAADYLADEGADPSEEVSESRDAVYSCMPKQTCGAGKVCGAWTPYTECGVGECKPDYAEVCIIPGRGGGSGNNAVTTHTKSRTRTCTMPGGSTCTEVHLSFMDWCDCYIP